MKVEDLKILKNLKIGDVIYTTFFVYANYSNTKYWEYNYVSIFKKMLGTEIITFATFDLKDNVWINNDNYLGDAQEVEYQRFGTEEEKNMLFDIMRKRGYLWDSKKGIVRKIKSLDIKGI